MTLEDLRVVANPLYLEYKHFKISHINVIARGVDTQFLKILF